MGYRSDVVIAIKKAVLARDLITQEIPAVVKRLDKKETEKIIYFFINDWKWYESNQEVNSIEKWMNSMDDDDFGAVRIGEDVEDSETWGRPHMFDVYIERNIITPV